MTNPVLKVVFNYVQARKLYAGMMTNKYCDDEKNRNYYNGAMLYLGDIETYILTLDRALEKNEDEH